MIAIYDKRDLRRDSETKDLRNIDITDISMESTSYARSMLAIIVIGDRFKIMKSRYYEEDDGLYDIFDITDLNAIISDHLIRNQSIGQSSFLPGTRKMRE